MPKKSFTTPFVLPVASFALAILAGSALLWLDISTDGEPVRYVDALFIATSSVCVTGLDSIGIAGAFNRTGHAVMLVLIQLGGLGIVTYSTLLFYMFSKKISLRDRVAVGQALLHDTTFHLGRFLQRIVVLVLAIEAIGTALLVLMHPEKIGIFSAVFLSVSAFCNAGFALWPDNLIGWQNDWGVNLVVMALIILGGIGFFVTDEILRVCKRRLHSLGSREKAAPLRVKVFDHLPAQTGLSYYSRVVLGTTAGLVFFGALLIFLSDLGNAMWREKTLSDRILISLFQSVTSRTAGFTSMDTAAFTDFAVLTTIVLMFIGGSPGSCAGGIKTTTFRVLLGYVTAQMRGHRQVIVKGWAMGGNIVNKVLLLFYFSVLTIVTGTLLLALTENGHIHHAAAPFAIADLFFEVVSAFGTVGLSINVTPRLSDAGKVIICLIMFIGRLGPIWLITMIQQFQTEPAYRYPERELPIG